MLLSGPPGIGKTTVAKALCNQLEQITMSLMGRMKDVFSTLFGRTQRTSQQRSLLRLRRVTKSLSSTKQTIPLPTYSSFSERLLRSSLRTVDLSSPATTKTKLSTLYIVGVLLSISRLIKKTNQQSVSYTHLTLPTSAIV